ncbi:MAG: aminoacyl-tRNA hydrolase [Candidatus Andersenbacteria bacterium]
MPVRTKKIVLVGLGNPGKKYEFTRHNLGFRVLERVRGELSLPAWSLQKALAAEISDGRVDGAQVILVRPQTFMNESGKSIKAVLKKFGARLTNLWVVHDDKDLPLGQLKSKAGSSSAGHRGVDSLISELGSNNFKRYRMGIWADSAEGIETDKFVITKFLPEEEPTVRNFIDKTTEQLISDLGLKR